MPRHISILFPGQGSQHIGMLDNLPTELVESFRGLALKALSFDLIDLIKNGNEENFNPYIAFGEIIRDEDYVAAAASHKGLRSGKIDHILFGQNEPALHHYHNTYREALNLEPMPLIKSK